MKKLKDLTKEEFIKLKDIGMLYELYPDAPDTYEELERNHKIIMLSDNEIDLTNLKSTLNSIINDITLEKYDNEDNEYYVYEATMKTFYGEDIFDKINKITK